MENFLHRLKTFFDPFIKTSMSEWGVLEKSFTVEQFKNRTTVKAAGEREHFLRFILEGAAAVQAKQGTRDICIDLCFENDFLTDFESLNGGHPTDIYIRTFEPVRALLINRMDLFRIYNTSALGAQLQRVLAERQNQRSQKNNIGYLGKTTEERYRKLQQDRPELLLRTPQHYIASYLGVSTENLSRVRKRIGRKPS